MEREHTQREKEVRLEAIWRLDRDADAPEGCAAVRDVQDQLVRLSGPQNSSSLSRDRVIAGRCGPALWFGCRAFRGAAWFLPIISVQFTRPVKLARNKSVRALPVVSLPRARPCGVHRNREDPDPGDAALPSAQGETPTGSITFMVNGVAAGPRKELDGKGKAHLTLDSLDAGAHKIRASYTSEHGQDGYHTSSSPNLLHTVEKGAHPGGPPGKNVRIWIIVFLLSIIAGYWYCS